MFHFTIRDVLWLMVVVGLSVGWFLTTRHLSSVEAKNKTLQTTLDSIKRGVAKARTDEQMRRAYDGPSRRGPR